MSVDKETDDEVLFSLKNSMSIWTIMIAPMIPHIAEELWKIIGNSEDLSEQIWPKFKKEYILDEKINLVVQINGKKKLIVNIQKGLSNDEIETIVLKNKELQKYLKVEHIEKIIIIPDRVVNLVI